MLMELEHKWTEQERQSDKILPKKEHLLKKYPGFFYALTIAVQILLIPLFIAPYVLVAGDKATFVSNLFGWMAYFLCIANVVSHPLILYVFQAKYNILD